MSFKPQKSLNYNQVIKLTKYKYLWIYEKGRDPEFVYLHTINYHFLVDNKNKLQENLEPRDYLSLVKVNVLNSFPITYHNNITKESFNVTWYLLDVTFKGFFKKYIYNINSGRSVKIYDYTFSSNFDNLIAVSIQDILKHYYYNNRDKPHFGFDNLDESDAKIYMNLIKRASTEIITPNLKNLFGKIAKDTSRQSASFYLYRIENNLPKWTFDTFLSGLVLASIKTFMDPVIVKSIIDFYVKGHTQTDQIELVEYDPPVPLEQAYRENEDLESNGNRQTYHELTRELKPIEKEQIDKYQEIILDPGNYGFNNWGRIQVDDPGEKKMNYPSFAFRKYLVSNWYPGQSSGRINNYMSDRLEDQKNSMAKYLGRKRGRSITRDDSEANYKIFYGQYGYLSEIRGDKLLRLRSKDQRATKYDIKESIQIADENYPYSDEYMMSDD